MGAEDVSVAALFQHPRLFTSTVNLRGGVTKCRSANGWIFSSPVIEGKKENTAQPPLPYESFTFLLRNFYARSSPMGRGLRI